MLALSLVCHLGPAHGQQAVSAKMQVSVLVKSPCSSTIDLATVPSVTVRCTKRRPVRVEILGAKPAPEGIRIDGLLGEELTTSGKTTPVATSMDPGLTVVSVQF